MSCITPSIQEIEDLKRKLDKNKIKDAELLDKVTPLLRGGVIVHTSIGNIQIGMPPETVKDCITMKIAVPNIFIVPSQRFNRERFLNVCEFEFPAYFNFFVTRKKIIMICTREEEEKLRIVFQETLLGPKEFPNFEKEFAENLPKGYIPDIKRELAQMAVNPFTREVLTIDTLLEFVNYDQNNEVLLQDGKVKIVKTPGFFEFYEEGVLIAKSEDKIRIKEEGYYAPQKLREEKKKLIKQSSNDIVEEDYDKPLGFRPPSFGITILGSSHGFDAHGSTSGYIFWVDGRGIMVDPPPFSSQGLEGFGIPPNLIDRIIISHCHADHDSGAFQKILHTTRVEIVTTPTIMGSFLRKYSALTDIPLEEFRELFIFRPVIIGKPMQIGAGHFKFFYSYHSIPCLGFEVEFCGRYIYFSGDTFFEPLKLEELYAKGVFSRERYESLAEINWLKFDVILHESGVPPIHTSVEVLKHFPEEVKERMYLVHIAEKDLPEGCNLKIAKTGLENTLEIEVNPKIDKTCLKLDLLSSVEFLNEIPLIKARDLVRCCQEEKYMPGQVIVKEGTKGSKFYIVQSGIGRIFSNTEGKIFSKFIYCGDYFGETALISEGFRNANVVAFTELIVFSLEKIDFKWIFGIIEESIPEIKSGNHEDHPMVRRLLGLSKTMKGKFSQFLNENGLFKSTPEAQKIQLNMIISHEKIEKGAILWPRDTEPNMCFFFITGSIFYDSPIGHDHKLKRGDLVGDFAAIVEGKVTLTEAFAEEDTEILKIEAPDFKCFLMKNPGLYLLIRDKYLIY